MPRKLFIMITNSPKETSRLIAIYIVIIVLILILFGVSEIVFSSAPGWLVSLLRLCGELGLITIGFGFAYKLLNRAEKGYIKPRKRETRYQQVLDNMMEGIQVIGSDWKYFYLNDAAVQQSQYKREELLGRTFMDMYPGVEQTTLFGHMKACMRDRKVASIENDFTFPSGEVRHFELCMEPIPEGLFILSLDITDKKKREKERADRLEETKQILHRISHEVRRPVTGIMGLSHLLEAEALNADELPVIVGMMQESVQSMDKYTRDLSN